ncbi:hypothetical protein FA15DRAFT_654065 [Coprinopsis marcescibilis]|uniref:Uncharacterized protein n=1 Tax=Coprinopsis marcescibilis TaxID=230819 RepID=A0A5C3L2C6_COPMA|nr:hypothetical protein FA15DRAFT_654065 [Coprinopsis marcescibilis]
MFLSPSAPKVVLPQGASSNRTFRRRDCCDDGRDKDKAKDGCGRHPTSSRNPWNSGVLAHWRRQGIKTLPKGVVETTWQPLNMNIEGESPVVPATVRRQLCRAARTVGGFGGAGLAEEAQLCASLDKGFDHMGYSRVMLSYPIVQFKLSGAIYVAIL